MCVKKHFKLIFIVILSLLLIPITTAQLPDPTPVTISDNMVRANYGGVSVNVTAYMRNSRDDFIIDIANDNLGLYDEMNAIFIYSSSSGRPQGPVYLEDNRIVSEPRYLDCSMYSLNSTMNPNYYWCYNETTGEVYDEGEYIEIEDSVVTYYQTHKEDWRELNNYVTGSKWGYFYYRFNNVPFEIGTQHKVKIPMEFDINTNGKIDIFIWPSNLTIDEAIALGHYIFIDPWWDSNFECQQQITIENTNSTAVLPEDYTITTLQFDTRIAKEDRASNCDILANGNDVRVIYQDTTEIDRINLTEFDAPNTNISFSLQEQIPAGASDAVNYSIYYGNAAAGIPLHDSGEVMFGSMNYSEYQIFDGGGGTIAIINDDLIRTLDVTQEANTSAYDKMKFGLDRDFLQRGCAICNAAQCAHGYPIGYSIDSGGWEDVADGVGFQHNTPNLVLRTRLGDVNEAGGNAGGAFTAGDEQCFEVWRESTNISAKLYTDTNFTNEVFFFTKQHGSVQNFTELRAYASRSDDGGSPTDIDITGTFESRYILQKSSEPIVTRGAEEQEVVDAPEVVILSPTNNSIIGDPLVRFNASIIPATGSIDTALIQLDNNANVTLINDSGNWNTQIQLSSGPHTARIFANNTGGVANFTEEVVFNVSSINLTVVNPKNITHVNTILPLTLLIENDTKIDNIFYNLNGGGNIFISSNTSIIAVEGLNNITVSVNQTSGSIASETIFFTVIEDPITIFSPLNTTTTNPNPLLNASFNLTVNASWLNIDSTVNQSFRFDVSNLTVQLSGFSNGLHNITVYVNDSGGVENSAIVGFTIDTTLPIITFQSPTPVDGASIGAFNKFKVRANMTSLSGFISRPVLRVEKADNVLFGQWDMDFSNASGNDLTASVEIELPAGSFTYLVQTRSETGILLNSSSRTITVATGNINIDFIPPSPDDDGIIYRKTGFTVTGLVRLVSGTLSSADLFIVDVDGVTIIPSIVMDTIEKNNGDWIITVSVVSDTTKGITANQGFIYMRAVDAVGTKFSIMRKVFFRDPSGFDISCMFTSSGRDCQTVGSMPGGQGFLDFTFKGTNGRFIVSILLLVSLLMTLQSIDAGNLVSGMIIGSISMLLSVNGWLPQWVWVFEVILISLITMRTLFEFIGE